MKQHKKNENQLERSIPSTIKFVLLQVAQIFFFVHQNESELNVVCISETFYGLASTCSLVPRSLNSSRKFRASVARRKISTVKPGFHMIATIAEKKNFSDRSDHEIWKPLYTDRSDRNDNKIR